MGQDYNYIQLIEQNVAIRWLHAFLHLLVMLSDVVDGTTGKHIVFYFFFFCRFFSVHINDWFACLLCLLVTRMLIMSS